MSFQPLRIGLRKMRASARFSIAHCLSVLLTSFAVLLTVVLPATAKTPLPRVALVIGNSNYVDPNIENLPNPKNDARSIAGTLRRLNFKVIEGTDLTYEAFSRTIDRFVALAQKSSAAMIFYAGHGFQFRQKNHLLPVDFTVSQLKGGVSQPRTIDLTQLVTRLEGITPVRLLFLDACRDDPSDTPAGAAPFAATLAGGIRAVNRRSVRGGGRPLVTQGYGEFSGASGTFIAFATAPGKAALDGTGNNSPFAGALLKHIETPGQRLVDLIRLVRTDVINTTRAWGHEQIPWSSSSLGDIFYFAPTIPQGEINSSVQASLKLMGCFPGRVRRQWGRSARRALARFNAQANTDFDVNRPAMTALGPLRQQWEQGFRCAPVTSLPNRSRPKKKLSPVSRRKPGSSPSKRRRVSVPSKAKSGNSRRRRSARRANSRRKSGSSQARRRQATRPKRPRSSLPPGVGAGGGAGVF